MSARYSTEAARWAALRVRDPNAEGHFFYCVKTTNVYCRPTCSARLARRSNISFANSAAEAQAAGYRACKRCRPEQAGAFVPDSEQSIDKVRQMLENLSDTAPLPRLDVMAATAGLTKYHFHRCFKKATGLTPRDYALQRRQIRQSKALPQPATPVESDISTPSLVPDSYVCPTFSTTPEVTKTPDLAFDDWLVNSLDDPVLSANFYLPEAPGDLDTFPLQNGLESAKMVYDVPMTFEIYYSIVEAIDGALLMAFEDGQICKLELTSTPEEAMISLEQSFAKEYYLLVPIAHMQDGQKSLVQQKVKAVVEALVNPFGTTTNADIAFTVS